MEEEALRELEEVRIVEEVLAPWLFWFRLLACLRLVLKTQKVEQYSNVSVRPGVSHKKRLDEVTNCFTVFQIFTDQHSPD